MKLFGEKHPAVIEPNGRTQDAAYQFDVGLVAGKQHIIFKLTAKQDTFIPKGSELHLALDVDLGGDGLLIKEVP